METLGLAVQNVNQVNLLELKMPDPFFSNKVILNKSLSYTVLPFPINLLLLFSPWIFF